MEKVSITSAARHFRDLLKRVAHQGASFEVERGGKSIALLVPAGPSVQIKVFGLNTLFARLPSLKEDGDAYVRDAGDMVSKLPPDTDRWD